MRTIYKPEIGESKKCGNRNRTDYAEREGLLEFKRGDREEERNVDRRTIDTRRRFRRQQRSLRVLFPTASIHSQRLPFLSPRPLLLLFHFIPLCVADALVTSDFFSRAIRTLRK